MDALFAIVVLLVLTSPCIAAALRRTPFWMVPGALLMIGAVLLLVTIDPGDGDVGGVRAMGNGLQAIGALIVGGFGLIAFVAGAAGSKPVPVPSVAPLPVARTHQL